MIEDDVDIRMTEVHAIEEVMGDFFDWAEIRLFHYLVFASRTYEMYTDLARLESIKYYRSIFGR